MDVPEKQMSLPPRQQAVLDQIERVLQAADPQLKSMFAAFARLAPAEAAPATEAITRRSARQRMVLVSVVLLSVLSLVTVFMVATSRACPGLSSDQVTASGTVRFAACSKATDAWSKGGR
jgi:ferric-dicitrate binding protein FerR (iron transport regulator)